MPKDNRDFFKTKKIWSEVKDELLGCYLVPYFNKILSMGNPILYVDCFAGKGKFDDGKNGYLIPVYDKMEKKERIQKLTECIIRLFTEADLEAFHKHSYEKAKAYLTEEVEKAWKSVL